MLDKYAANLMETDRLHVNDPVFCVQSELHAIYDEKIKQMKARKGCDASNKFDEEVELV